MTLDSKNPWNGIVSEDELLKAFVEAQLKVIANTSSDISGDAQQLKAWFERYLFYADAIRGPVEIDWSPYILENHEPKSPTE